MKTSTARPCASDRKVAVAKGKKFLAIRFVERFSPFDERRLRDSRWILKVSNKFFTVWKYPSFTSSSVDDISMLFRPRLLRCWSTAGQSPFTDSARTRFKISHRRIDGGVFVSKSTLEPLRDCDWATAASDPGLGGRSEGRRLEGFDPGPPFGIMEAMRKLNQFFTKAIFFLFSFNTTFTFPLVSFLCNTFFTLLIQCRIIISPQHSVMPKVDLQLHILWLR